MSKRLHSPNRSIPFFAGSSKPRRYNRTLDNPIKSDDSSYQYSVNYLVGADNVRRDGVPLLHYAASGVEIFMVSVSTPFYFDKKDTYRTGEFTHATSRSNHQRNRPPARAHRSRARGGLLGLDGSGAGY